MRKKLQTVIKRSIKISEVSASSVTKNLKKIQSVARKYENVCRNWLTVLERNIEEKVRSVEVFFDFLRLNSSVIGLFIGFLAPWYPSPLVGFWQFLVKGRFEGS